MKAIILSAGQGKRLLPLTKDTPKAALKIGTQSLLGWQLQEISKTSIEEEVVITGFGADKIEELVENSSFHDVRTFFNPFYQNCDSKLQPPQLGRRRGGRERYIQGARDP